MHESVNVWFYSCCFFPFFPLFSPHNELFFHVIFGFCEIGSSSPATYIGQAEEDGWSYEMGSIFRILAFLVLPKSNFEQESPTIFLYCYFMSYFFFLCNTKEQTVLKNSARKVETPMFGWFFVTHWQTYLEDVKFRLIFIYAGREIKTWNDHLQ